MENFVTWFNGEINNLTLYLQVESIEMYGLSITKLIVASLFIGIVLALFAVRGPHLWARALATLVLLPTLALSILIAVSDGYSNPKNIPVEWWLEKYGELKVLGVKEYHQNIIAVFTEHRGKPRLFKFPWTEKLSQSLNKALKERGKRKGAGDLMLRKKRFQSSIETEDPPEFYFDPWEAPPSKDDDKSPEPEPDQRRPGRGA